MLDLDQLCITLVRYASDHGKETTGSWRYSGEPGSRGATTRYRARVGIYQILVEEKEGFIDRGTPPMDVCWMQDLDTQRLVVRNARSSKTLFDLKREVGGDDAEFYKTRSFNHPNRRDLNSDKELRANLQKIVDRLPLRSSALIVA